MTPEQKADKLYKKYLNIIYPMRGLFVKRQTKLIAKVCSIEACDMAMESLVEYGRNHDQIQNMEYDFRWWENVKQEIEKI